MTADFARCGAKARAGRPCRKPAGAGTDHLGHGRCLHHAGSTPNGRIAAAREQAAAEAARLGVEIETDPHEALSEIVAIIGGQVQFLQSKVREIDEGEALSADALHPTIRALNSVLDQWQRAATAAANAGVEERRLELDEIIVERIGEAMRTALVAADLTVDQQAKVRVALSERLAELNGLDLHPGRRLTP